MVTATSQRSRTRQSWRQTCTFCSKAAAYPPASAIFSLISFSHLPNILLSLWWTLRLESSNSHRGRRGMKSRAPGVRSSRSTEKSSWSRGGSRGTLPSWIRRWTSWTASPANTVLIPERVEAREEALICRDSAVNTVVALARLGSTSTTWVSIPNAAASLVACCAAFLFKLLLRAARLDFSWILFSLHVFLGGAMRAGLQQHPSEGKQPRSY
mmetsp:Transcript_53489/g.122428  ORF Transcript_53489/g.122428 Transcript_53489/m.122428 type:complete len:212 (-) Transcript_53489:3-638(-)